MAGLRRGPRGDPSPFGGGGWFSFSSSETRIRCRRSCHKEQGDTTRRPAQAVGVRSGGGRLEEGACGGASGENRWSVGGVGGSEGGIRPGRRPVIQDCGGQAPAWAKPLRQTLAQGETKGLSRGNWLAPSMGRAMPNPLGSGGGGCLGGNGDVRSGAGSAVLRRPGVPGITTPPDIGGNLDYLAKIFWPGGSTETP